MLKEKVLGGLWGVIVGDALGLPVQFLSRKEVRENPVSGMIGYGTFDFPPGTWSDDSSLTLCLVESLSISGYDIRDIAKRFLRWYNDGHLTPFGQAFDIGGSTREAMENLMDDIPPLEAGPKDEFSNGNGSLMRILPAAIYFAGADEKEMIKRTCEISRITHGHPRSQLACCLYVLLVKELLMGKRPTNAYQGMISKVPVFKGTYLEEELVNFERILNGSLALLPEELIKSTGYVVDTLEAAIWCLLNYSDFMSTLIAAVNLGEDTDTVGAVVGGLAGVCYGYDEIPEEWLAEICDYKNIEPLFMRFFNSLDD